MAIDRKLLRKAWPKGYVALRGVQTVGGWQCLGDVITGDEHWQRWLHRSLNGEQVFHGTGNTAFDHQWKNICHVYGIDKNDLLPNVDPADTATWACLLKDLAEACPGDENPLGPPKPLHGLTWVQTMKKRWELGDGSRVASKYFRLGTDDPAKALVLARIQLRETS